MSSLASRLSSLQLPANAAGETAHGFGAGLVGIVHRPAVAGGHRIGVILLNAGLVRRIGPFRGSVALARALAAAGFPVLRYDQSGLGDSAVSTSTSGDRRRDEMTSAMNVLARQSGVERFVIGGICSGADDAFHLAKDDPRIAGTLLLDGLAYRTKGFWLKHALPRLAKPSKVLQFLRRRSEGEAGMEDFRDFPPQAEAVKQLEAMVARDARLLFLFTGGAYSYFNHAAQLADCFGPAAKAKQVALEFWPDCDHTFYLQRDRERLQRLVVAWMRAQFVGPTQR
jgi:pimeloyl-ACP methyl ester carboxylesterase